MSSIVPLWPFIGFGILLVISAIVWYIIQKYAEESAPNNAMLVDNFMPQYTNGFSHGKMVEKINGSKRIYIKFMPTDIDSLKYYIRNKPLIIEPVGVWVERKKFVPIFDWSNERNRAWILPPTPEDLPESLKVNAPFMLKLVEDINQDIREVKMLREDIKSIELASHELRSEKSVRAVIERARETYDDIINASIKEKDRRFTGTGSGYPPTTPP